MTRPYVRHKADAVLAAIVAFKTGNDGRSPTLREIGEACGISSTSVIHRLLRELAGEGRIRLPGGVNRGIEVAGGMWVLTDPEARFPRPAPPGKCDICGRKASWRDGRYAYCHTHEPAP